MEHYCELLVVGDGERLAWQERSEQSCEELRDGDFELEVFENSERRSWLLGAAQRWREEAAVDEESRLMDSGSLRRAEGRRILTC